MISLRDKLEQAGTITDLMGVWHDVCKVREENMSSNTFNKCERVFEEKVDSFQKELVPC